ncbi:hypothetical protein I4990_17320 [Providencia alcalifaciens]|uniref:hypothetical protein n=1 Tax=Providencia alcalifaciens TaxID=126385 RepID=UPI0018C65D48|nr:hypothetical protein [Providencia alcalifaciens]MBG5884703.1 hypothetical protein [Providencia alcalifaciens]
MHKNESYSRNNTYLGTAWKLLYEKSKLMILRSYILAIFYIFSSHYNIAIAAETWSAISGKSTLIPDVGLQSENLEVGGGNWSPYNYVYPTAISISTISNSGSCSYPENYPTFTTIDGYSGLKIAEGILLIIDGAVTGTTKATTNSNATKNFTISFNGSGGVPYSLTNTLNILSTGLCSSGVVPPSDNQYTGASSVNVRYSLYISPSASAGTYVIPDYYWRKESGSIASKIFTISNSTITIEKPMMCTINTPPKIDFGKVNVWDWGGNTSGTPGGNRKDVLGVADGNFMINCTGDNGAHSPAKLTLKGNTQGYANDLKMTMNATGEVAPATVRASIKSIKSACSSDGIYFDPSTNPEPGNVVDLGGLTVGSHQVPYRFSLCALGEGFKIGAASATATVTIDWE